MKRTDTAGFDMVNWIDYCPVEAVSLTFSRDVLESLPSYGVVPEGYDGYPYDATYRDLKLFVENIGPGYYHVSIRDYSCGWTRDLGDGNYDYDYDEHPGWSDLERILADLRRRIDAGEIDLDRALMEYYTVGEDALRLKPSCIRKGWREEQEASQKREAIRARLASLENRYFARACIDVMRRGGISGEDTEKLTDEDFCKITFGASMPILKRTFAQPGFLPRKEAVNDDDEQKYYFDVHELNGARYIITNDWYGFRPDARRNTRAPFVEWLLQRVEL